MIITFDDKEQLEHISSFVSIVSDVHDKLTSTCLSSVAAKLIELKAALKDNPEVKLVLNLSENSSSYYDQVYCLYKVCSLLSRVNVNDVMMADAICNKLKANCAESDVPRFLDMLKDNNVPAESCVGLFSSWCSCEGTAELAEKCMMVQSLLNNDMTAVWKWVCNNDPSQDTDWPDEVNKYKEAINGHPQTLDD